MRVVLPVEELQPLWIVDEDILSANGLPLVLHGAVVTPALKDAMTRHGIVSIRVRTDDEEEWNPGGPLSPKLVLKVKQDVQKLVVHAVRRRSLSPQLLSNIMEQTSAVVDALFTGEAPLFAELRSLSNYDAYTYEHSWSVMLLSLSLARVAWESGILEKLDLQDRLNLGMGAVLHDIGKTLLPPALLNKEGPLDEEEWKLMRLHPQKGVDLLRPYKLVMPMVRAIVAFHHERPDGGGYGLAKGATLYGGEIPRLVRVVSVADAYDAMVSSRPYRRARLPFEALEILASEAGRQFDADLVPLMERIVVPFPVGSLLLLKDGSVASVRSPGDLKGRRSLPECLVVAAFLSGGRYLPGETFVLRDRSQIALGATGPDDLVGKMVEDVSRQRPPFSDTFPLSLVGALPLTLACALPLWDQLFMASLDKFRAAVARVAGQ
ncbi:HD-GYP domain-containing protein [Aminirod propionatiphilus]|uniref:HD-GYP domain-containing protein n=1 Tax=Aminirod propionatiphilus TaxID=3415223 RepID=A0ACD1DWL3_9BACT|nr:HD-GYP domain-containing protein [Synergistota bacterium]